MNKERTELKRENVIEIRCKQCKKRFFDYMISCENDSDNEVVMSGISLKCDRCNRVMIMKKYTQGYLVSHSRNGVFKI